MQKGHKLNPEKIRIERERRGWSRATLASKIGKGESYIGRLENGNRGWKRDRSIATLDRIAQVFHRYPIRKTA